MLRPHMISRRRRLGLVHLVCAAALAACAPTDAFAQNRIGGHIGFVLPLVTRAQGATTTIADDFVIGFPMGITVKTSRTVAFDLELVPGVQNQPLHVDLTVHPGVIWSLGSGTAAGIRAAFDVGAASWGFTPLLNKGLVRLDNDVTLFGEVVLPIRFKQDLLGSNFTAIGLGVHFGIGF